MLAASIPLDLALQLILYGWDEEPIGIDSESDISNVEDPEYPTPLNMASQTEESSDESSDEEMDIVSNRMSRMSCKGRVTSQLGRRAGPVPGFTTVSTIDTWKLLVSDNKVEKAWTCTTMEGRVTTDGGKEWKNCSFPQHMGPVSDQLPTEIHPQ